MQKWHGKSQVVYIEEMYTNEIKFSLCGNGTENGDKRFFGSLGNISQAAEANNVMTAWSVKCHPDV